MEFTSWADHILRSRLKEMSEASVVGGASSASEQGIQRKSSPDTWQRAANAEELAKSFDLWYASTQAALEQTRKCETDENRQETGETATSWYGTSDEFESKEYENEQDCEGLVTQWLDTTDEFESETHLSNISDEVLDEPGYISSEVLQSSQPFQEAIPYSFEQYKEPRVVIVKRPKWPLSRAPSLSCFKDKYKDKIFPAKMPARKISHGSGFGSSWTNKTSSWEERTASWAETSGEDRIEDTDSLILGDGFEISHSEVTWTETQSMEIDKTFRKYRTYAGKL